MKLYDITKELFSSEVYPGDVPPTFIRQLKIEEGAPCNLTVLNMCAHNGTHIDAPCHFCNDGKSIEELDLRKCVGQCSVINFNVRPDIKELKEILKKCEKRILLKGNITVTLEVAKLFNKYKIELVGVEGQSVAPEEITKEVHVELLKQEVVILEGICLEEVLEGSYFLSAAPLKLGGSDGAPCRAVLIEF